MPAPRRLPAAAVLSDMDGVLVDSTAAVEAHWSRWAARRGLNPEDVLLFAHGSPSRDVVARFVGVDEVAAEAAWVEALTMEAVEELALPGALDVLTQRLLPVAVVTSATREVARGRLQRAGLPVPRILVGADDVDRGKPDPEPYLRAADLLGVPIEQCVGFEDTPAGLASLRAAGATALALSTTYRSSELGDAVTVLRNLSVIRVVQGGVIWV